MLSSITLRVLIRLVLLLILVVSALIIFVNLDNIIKNDQLENQTEKTEIKTISKGVIPTQTVEEAQNPWFEFIQMFLIVIIVWIWCVCLSLKNCRNQNQRILHAEVIDIHNEDLTIPRKTSK